MCLIAFPTPPPIPSSLLRKVTGGYGLWWRGIVPENFRKTPANVLIRMVRLVSRPRAPESVRRRQRIHTKVTPTARQTWELLCFGTFTPKAHIWRKICAPGFTRMRHRTDTCRFTGQFVCITRCKLFGCAYISGFRRATCSNRGKPSRRTQARGVTSASSTLNGRKLESMSRGNQCPPASLAMLPESMLVLTLYSSRLC